MLPVLALLLVPQASRPIDDRPAVEIVESAPVETTLDHATLRNADVVWRELIDGARATLEFAEFYASDDPGRATALTAVVAAIERAAARGVRVRFLADQKFQVTYPDTLARLAACPGIQVRAFDLRRLGGGVLHAKYFVVDGTTTWVGSQNFDWRSFEHIQELGVRVGSRHVAAAFQAVFDADWALAGGAPVAGTMDTLATALKAARQVVATGDAADVVPVFSPRSLLPDESDWDLPWIVRLIDGAQRCVRVQLLTYRAGRGQERFADLDDALRRAAARGVEVELLLADWSMRKGVIEELQALEPLPHLAVRLVTIPPWSGGFVPFARVCHAKYLVVDGAAAWLGTSNWEKSYFHQSRNAGLVLRGPLAVTLDGLFVELWRSSYAQPVDPARTYVAPRTSEPAPASRAAPSPGTVPSGTGPSPGTRPAPASQPTAVR